MGRIRKAEGQEGQSRINVTSALMLMQGHPEKRAHAEAQDGGNGV